MTHKLLRTSPRAAVAALTAFAALSLSAPAWSAPMAMATYGEAYTGPKTLTVQLAANAQGDRALIKVTGVNHPWNNKVVLTEVRRDANNRVDYVARFGSNEFVVMQDSPDRGTLITLPGLGNLPLRFDRAQALETPPQHLLTDYERPDGAVKK
jgi:hypothetical protein